MKTHYLLLFFVLGSIVMGWSQPMANRVTGVTVPSPDAASLGKFGDIPVGHFTGSVSTSVPIHTLKAGPLSLNISLQYHSAGLRVAEPASWVGMGWALQTGGIISRTVQGTEDELSGGYLSQGLSLALDDSCVVHPEYSAPITSMANAQLDGEPDVFSFSVGGYNGKFYINASKTVVQIPKSDLKIEYTLNGSVSNVYRLKKFVITTPDGVKYQFGDIDDGNNAIDISTVNNSLFQTANNWKLKKIESADAAYHFLFTYEEEKFTYAMRARNGLYNSNGYSYNLLEQTSKRLFKITPSTGRGEITFTKEANVREDLGNPLVGTRTTYALDYIEVKSGNDSFCKKFDFSYSYLQDNSANNTGQSTLDKRLKLVSVQEKSCNNAITIPAYTFEYETDVSDANYYPTIVSPAIDHWGYFNGAFNNKSFAYNIPFTAVNYKNSAGDSVNTYQGGADREANETKMKLGVLKKITYPTGGSSSFDYEAHTIYENRTIYTFTPVSFGLSGSNCQANPSYFISNNISFSNISDVCFELNIKGYEGFCCNNNSFVEFQVFNTSGQPIGPLRNFYPECNPINSIKRGRLIQLNPALQSNTTYYIRFNIYHAEATLSLSLATPTTESKNNPVGGLRIKKITNKDAVNNANDVVKDFSYENANIPVRSSGILYNKPLYGFVYYGSSSPCNTDINSNIINHFWFDQSYVPLYSFEGYHLGYDNVKEYVNGAGYTQYRFLNDAPIIPTTFPYAPPRAGVRTGNMNLMAQRLGNNNEVAYTVSNEKPDSDESSSGTIVKAFWMYGDGTSIAVWKTYSIITRPFRWASVETYKDGLTLTSAYTYRTDQAHLLPIQTLIAHPDGTQEKLTVTYPADASHTSLLSKYMIHTPLEQRRYINSTQVSGVRTNYQDVSSFPRVATLQSWNTSIPDWETEATFNSYDAYGNPTSVTNRGWQAETYSWDKDLLTQKTFQSFTWQYEYETNTSLLKKYTEPSALFTTYGYDALGRNTSINQYNGKTSTTLAYAYSAGANKITVETTYDVGSTLKTEKEFDGLGRATYTRKIGYGSGNQDVVTRVDYDNAGRVKNEYLPGFSSAGAYTSYTYEDSPLRRPTTITPPAPLGSSTLTYGSEDNQWTQTTTNALNEYKKTWTDTRGRMRKSTVGGSSITNTTNYEYDDRNNLLKVMPHGTSSTDANYIYSYTYNGRNLVTKKKLPEKNDINLNYDSRDLATHLQDGIHPVVYTEYDVYGRPTKTGFVPNLSSTSISNTLTETSYKMTTGAGFGQPYITKASLLNTTGAPTGNFITREITAFDAYHRPTNFKSNHPLNLDNVEAITGETTFNRLDQITANTTNVKINSDTYTTSQANTYEQGTRLKKRTFSFNGITVTADEIMSFDAFDNPLQTKIGGNLQTVDYSYYGNGFLQKINGGSTGIGGLSLADNGTPSENTANDLFAMELNYQTNGNISSWKIQNRGFAALTNTYSYDNLQRITYASNDTQQETFTYRDPLGNFNSIVRNDLVKSGGNWVQQTVDNLTFSYADTKTNRINSIADASNNTLGYIPNNGSYAYDNNGNMTFDPSRGLILTNNFLNLPFKFIKPDGSRQELLYDATGHKWQERTFGANSGVLVGQKTYLEHMEFEGSQRSVSDPMKFEINELSMIHHPTGFIRKLNSANHLSGTQNGDAQGKTITSTQKIGDGRYTAINQVALLPGFEATAKDAFLAKIGSVSAYQLIIL